MYGIDDINDLDLLGDDVVLRRTVSGQHEAIAPSGQLSPAALRLLLLVNGYTPLGTLVENCMPDADIGLAVRQLAEHGLIRREAADEPFPPITRW